MNGEQQKRHQIFNTPQYTTSILYTLVLQYMFVFEYTTILPQTHTITNACLLIRLLPLNMSSWCWILPNSVYELTVAQMLMTFSEGHSLFINDTVKT